VTLPVVCIIEILLRLKGLCVVSDFMKELKSTQKWLAMLAQVASDAAGIQCGADSEPMDTSSEDYV